VSTARPRWRDLPELPDGARAAWAVGGPEDRLGTLALLTPERTARAVRLVRSGRRIRLDLPVGLPDPPLFGREQHRHEVLRRNRVTFDDRLDGYHPQGGSQWDALGHVGHPRHGFYGGRTADDVAAGALGIDAAAAGIIGRGVLLDVARWAQRAGRPFAPDAAHRISPADVLATAEEQGTALEQGDVWCVRTGWAGWYQGLEPADRRGLADRSRGTGQPFASAGLSPGREWAQLLWDAGAAALAVDNPAVDAMPAERGAPSLHSDVLPLLGLPLGELVDLEELSTACAADGRWEFLFLAVPLLVPGGMGSPANAVAVL